MSPPLRASIAPADAAAPARCATFCLNYPIVDDLAPDVNGRARFVTNQMCVARREIALVALGGFDGASFGATADGDCAIAQLRHANTLQLVHAAHARGLRIAMCAGQRPGDIADAVAAGVDIIRHLSGMVSPVVRAPPFASLDAREC